MKIKKGQWMAVLVGALVGSAYGDHQRVVDVHSVQARIAETRSNWRAQESWVTRLSREEITRMLGSNELPTGSLDFESATPSREVLDWRNVNGVNWLSPVMNQGNCGSCVAFAAVATMEGRTSIAAGIPYLRPTYSPQMLFGCGGGKCDRGWTPSSAAAFLKKTGDADEACLPYTSGSTGEDVACSQKCADSDARAVKIGNYSTPTWFFNNSADAVKKALKTGPLVTTMVVYADFVAYAGGIYKHVTGEQLGGHAVSLVGYDDVKRAWLVRNSWGTEWGEQGFVWVSYDDTSGIAANTWAFEMKPATGYLTVTAPADRAYVTGKFALVGEGKGLKGEKIRFRLKSGAQESTLSECTVGQIQSCSVDFDTTQMREGHYQIFADNGDGGVKSQIREFFVINTEPKMEVSFKAASGTDLTKPVSGRPEFLIKTISSPVPIQRLEFRVLDQDGKIVSVKGSDSVLEEMKMGWRSNSVPNGDYTILFHGEITYKGKAYPVESPSMKITVKN